MLKSGLGSGFLMEAITLKLKSLHFYCDLGYQVKKLIRKTEKIFK